MLDIPNEPIEKWLEVLKPYQRCQHFEALLSSNTPEEAARLWFEAQGASELSPFGGTPTSRKIYDEFIIELKKLLCGDPDSEEDRKKLTEQGPLVKEVIAYGIASTIASRLGLGDVGSLLAPAVVSYLYVIGRSGVRAWCNSTTPTAPVNIT